MNGICIAGYGYPVPKLARSFMAAAAGAPVAVGVESPARLLRARQDFTGVRTFGSLDGVLLGSEIKAVILATPVSTHFPMGRLALEAGTHVVAEEPFTNSVATAREAIESNSIKTGKPPTSDGAFGADVVSILECAETSVRLRGAEVSIP